MGYRFGNSGGNCIRNFLIIVNVLFLLGGLAILGLGIWVQVEKGDYVALADSDTGLTGAILLIAVGGVTSLVSIAGFIGAVKRSAILLWFYFFLLILITLVQIVAIAMGMFYSKKIADELHGDMKKSMQEYDRPDNEGVTKAWNWAQEKFKCCGVDNYTDWIFADAINPNGSHTLVPDSCCEEQKPGCGDFNVTHKTKIYTKGCFNELKEFINDHILYVGLPALFFLVFELILIILTILLAKSDDF